MNRFWKLLSTWGFPLCIGVAYWLFDASVHFLNPMQTNDLGFWSVLFPALNSVETIFRLVMTFVCVIGARYFESIMGRVERLEQQLFLNEFAVEHTKAFALIWTNGEGRIIKVNQYAADRLGYTKNELLSLSVFDLTPEHTTAKWEALLAKLKKQGNVAYATKQRKKDGTFVDAIVYLQYLKVKTDQYQFAFVCDAFYCPVVHADAPQTLCGRPTVKTLEQVLSS